MRALLAALAISLPAASGLAEVFNLREQGRLELFPVGEWNIHGDDQGDLKIQLTPKSPRDNAACEITVTAGGPDEYPTRAKLSRKVAEAAKQMLESGDFVEGTATVKPFYSKQGFGFYFTLTDPKLVGREPVPGDYKQVTMGMIRLSSGVMVEVQILSDGEKTEAYQQLLGMIEGMELQGK
jgi:cold shock CspA family protein